MGMHLTYLCGHLSDHGVALAQKQMLLGRPFLGRRQARDQGIQEDGEDGEGTQVEDHRPASG